MEGEVLGAVHGEGVDGGIAGHNGGRAVALVRIAVDDDKPQSPAAERAGFPLQDARCHRAVVEHAETFAAVGERVMRAAREADG